MRHTLLVFVFLSSIYSCGNKTSSENEPTLYGKWDIEAATRNGKRTTTLKDGFLEFNEDATMRTNLMGEVVTTDYTFRENKVEGGEAFDYTFDIEKLSSDTLILSGKMKVFNMIFYLRKADPKNDTLLHDHSHHEGGHNIET